MEPCAGRGERRWRQFSSSLPMRTALLAVGSVWILGCVWSYQEQSAFAASKGFSFRTPALVIDGFAVSMAGVAWASRSMPRAAIPPRPPVGDRVAVGASAASNGVWRICALTTTGHRGLGGQCRSWRTGPFECFSLRCAGRCSAGRGCRRRSRCPTPG